MGIPTVGARLSALSFLELLLLLLLVDAVCNPYAGLAHDALLYGAQILFHRIPDRLSADLFFLYGSQDKYSISSTLLSPISNILGIEGTLFVAYVASKVLLLSGVVTLFRALLQDQLLTLLCSLVLVLTPLPYGGLGVFHVSEQFYSPRLAAEGISLLGIAWLLEGRTAIALGSFVLAALLHPLMAVAGCGFLVLWKTAHNTKLLLATVCLIVTAVLFATLPFAHSLLGEIDELWYEIAKSRTPYNFPSAWRLEDWFWIIFQCGVVLHAVALSKGVVRNALLVSLLLTGLGILGAIAAECGRTALLIQIQPHRSLWLLAVVFPVAITRMLDGAFRSGRESNATLALVYCFIFSRGPRFNAEELGLFVALCGAVSVFFRGIRPTPRGSHWLLKGTFVGILAYASLELLVTAFSVLIGAAALPYDVPRTKYASAVLWAAGSLLPYLAALSFVCWLVFLNLRRVALAMIGVAAHAITFVLLQAGIFSPPRELAEAPATEFVINHIRPMIQANPTPTVIFWPRHLEDLWFILRTPSYFDWEQLAGLTFNRLTALEGKRRSQLTRAFDIPILEALGALDRGQTWMFGIYGNFERGGRPKRGDLIDLCNDRILDFAVLPFHFEGLAKGSGPGVWIYSCEFVREMKHNASEAS